MDYLHRLRSNFEHKELNFEISTDDMEEYFRRVITKDIGLFEFGINRSRFDLIRVNTRDQKIKGYEFKISRADFKRDDKWKYYLSFCHSLTFVCPYKLIDKSELPAGVGLLYIVKWRYKNPVWKRDDNRWIIEGLWVRRPRNQELDKDRYIYVISTLLNRVKWRQDEFF